jgi:hypothetical protein
MASNTHTELAVSRVRGFKRVREPSVGSAVILGSLFRLLWAAL